MLGGFKNFFRPLQFIFARRWVRRVSFVCLSLGLLGGLILHGYHYVNAPSTGTIIAAAAPEAPKPAAKITVHGTYADFKYPDQFSPLAADTPHAPQLALYAFIAHQTESWLLNIQVESLPSGNIANETGYNFRHAHPETYNLTQQQVNGNAVYIMTDVHSITFSKIAFVSKGTRVATISLSGGLPSDTETLNQVMTDLLTSWQWPT